MLYIAGYIFLRGWITSPRIETAHKQHVSGVERLFNPPTATSINGSWQKKHMKITQCRLMDENVVNIILEDYLCMVLMKGLYFIPTISSDKFPISEKFK